MFGFVKDYAFCMIQQYVKECWVAQGKRKKEKMNFYSFKKDDVYV